MSQERIDMLEAQKIYEDKKTILRIKQLEDTLTALKATEEAKDTVEPTP